MDLKNNILKSREIRYLKQKKILKKYQKGLITVTLNIPGQNKNKPLYDIFLKKIINKLLLPFLKNLNIIHLNQKRIFLKDYSGIYLNIVLNTGDENLLKFTKEKLIELEQKKTILIFVDIDIINIEYKYIKREFLQKAPRKCFLCNKAAKICAIEKNHNLKDLLTFIKVKMKKFLSNKIQI